MFHKGRTRNILKKHEVASAPILPCSPFAQDADRVADGTLYHRAGGGTFFSSARKQPRAVLAILRLRQNPERCLHL
jgi:hypothetical protein